MKNVKTIKKCYKVWDYLNSDGEEWGDNYVEYIMANSREEAKANFSDQHVQYIDRKAIRHPNGDDVELNGENMKRHRVWPIMRRIERNEKIDSLPNDDMYYVQKGIVGNDVLFWAKGSSGYVCSIDSAEKYTKDEIVAHFKNGREEDVIWPASHIEQHIKRVVDMQYLSHNQSI